MKLTTALEAEQVNPQRLTIALGGAVVAVVLAVVVMGVALSDAPAASDDPAPASLQPAFDATAISNGRNGAPLVLVSGEAMFPLPGGGRYTSWLNSPVVAQDVPVQSVTARGFWMGSNETQRVFVVIPPVAVEKGSLDLAQLQVGSLVNVSGYVRELPDNLRPFALDESARSQLERAQVLLEANSVRLPRAV